MGPQSTVRTTGRFSRAGLLLAGGLVLYAPYAAWVSLRLGRFSPAPGIEYLNDMRWVCDQLHLREMEGPYLPWSERTVFVLAADHRRRVLETYFDERILLTPAARFSGSGEIAEDMSPAATSASAADPGRPTDPPVTRQALVRRRLRILAGNLKQLPSTLYQEHFLPLGPVLLAFIGLLTGHTSPGRRRGLVFLAAMGALSLTPLLSHIEARFLYVPFAFALVLGAGGWSWLAQRLPAVAKEPPGATMNEATEDGPQTEASQWREGGVGWRGGPAGSREGAAESRSGVADVRTAAAVSRRGVHAPRRVLLAALHAGLLVLVALAGFRHTDGVVDPLSRRALQKEIAALAADCGNGPILAVQQHVPFYARRPYRAIPVGDPDLVLDYARRQGASCLVLEGERDLRRRPELVPLMNDPTPSGLRLLAARPHPEGGEMRLFCVEP
jgi:hypothetical protein